MKYPVVDAKKQLKCLQSGSTLKVEASNLSELRRVNQNLLSDIACAASKAGINDISFSALIEGHRVYTQTGNVSRHARGLAVDINRLDGFSLTSPVGKDLANRFVKQLQKLGYVLNVENGNPKAVLWQTDGHWRHIHVSRLN